MKLLNFALGFILCFLLIALLPSDSVVMPEPEIKMVVQTKYITKTEYVKINQTEPMEMTVTAYTAGPESTGKRPGGKGFGITFTGTQARPGVCAVDPNYIPLGSMLFVDGYGYCTAEDTGGKVDGWHIDVFIEDVPEALKFGRETRKVWILKNFGEEHT